jgi:hypothetical protein
VDDVATANVEGGRKPSSEFVKMPDRSTRHLVDIKLILNHQESRTCQNHNMFKFRALLGKACLHNKGQQQTCLKCMSKAVFFYSDSCSTVTTVATVKL